jgi:hypothetical protein
VYRTLNTNKIKYENFLHEVGRSGYQKSRIKVSPVLMTFNCQRSKQHQWGLNWNHQADCPGMSGYTNMKKYLLVGRETRSILQDGVKCVLHIRSELKLETFVNYLLFHFTKGPVLRNTIQ